LIIKHGPEKFGLRCGGNRALAGLQPGLSLCGYFVFRRFVIAFTTVATSHPCCFVFFFLRFISPPILCFGMALISFLFLPLFCFFPRESKAT
jgi:hypothetical protein